MTAPVLTLHKPAAAPALELRPAAELIPYARNSNTHPPGQLAKLRASIAEYGWTNPVLVDESGGVVAGHGRLLAYDQLLKAGETVRFPNGSPIPAGMVPVLSCAGWSEAQRRAYVIADNRIAAESVLDDAVLALEVADLSAMGFDLALTGLDDDEVSGLLASLGPEKPDGDPDAVPAVPDEPVSRLGDVWVCGAHRVACGDSTDPDTWAALMGGELANVCFTDPPFNVDLGLKNRRMDKAVGGRRDANGSIDGDKMSPGDFRELLAGAYACLFAQMLPGSVIYVAHADKVADVFRSEFEVAGFHFSQLLIWNKGHHVIGMADFQPSHESIAYGWKPGSHHKWFGGRRQRTIIEAGEGGPIKLLPDGRWSIRVGDQVLIVDGAATLEESPSTVLFEPKPAASGLHPSTKPVALVERLIGNSARAGDIVLDAFGGSGTTLIAAERLGMCARLVELTPKYTDVICRRYWQYTGRRPVHAVTGAPFPDDGQARETPPAPDPAPGLDAF